MTTAVIVFAILGAILYFTQDDNSLCPKCGGKLNNTCPRCGHDPKHI